jgi:hypothetical protein
LPFAAATVGGYGGLLEDRGLGRVHGGGIHIGVCRLNRGSTLAD